MENVTSPAPRALAALDQQGHPDDCHRAHQAGEEATKGAIQIPDLGPRQGTYRSSSLYVDDQNRRLFLRSAEPVATRVEREYQRPAQAVLCQGHRPVGAFASP